jgi:hypothetical protein
VIIAARFNGPPSSGNGGYTAGRIATYVAETGLGGGGLGGGGLAGARAGIEVTLRRPPPLETELTVQTHTNQTGTATVRVYHGTELVAEAGPAAVDDGEAVPAIGFADAHRVSASYRGFTAHPFPTCFVCGPEREPGDGLRLFPGMLPDGRTATPFLAPPDVSPEMVWAALDCPGGWSVPLEARPYVLGRMAARVNALPQPGDECVVMGLMVGEDGRKAYVRSSLVGPGGDLLALARATWIAAA